MSLEVSVRYGFALELSDPYDSFSIKYFNLLKISTLYFLYLGVVPREG